MAITLEETSWSARTVKFGKDNFEVAAGMVLKIETSPDGVELLNEGPPAGKQWTSVYITVNIEETDA